MFFFLSLFDSMIRDYLWCTSVILRKFGDSDFLYQELRENFGNSKVESVVLAFYLRVGCGLLF